MKTTIVFILLIALTFSGVQGHIEKAKQPETSEELLPPATLGCEYLCPYNLTYDAPEHICSFNGISYLNKVCPNSGTFLSCTYYLPLTGNYSANLVVQSPGVCSCPSNCSSSYRGTCLSTSSTKPSCSCSDGYSGVDCSSVTCQAKSPCSGRGTCGQLPGTNYSYCHCQAGYGGLDCSATTPTLPAIIPAFGAATPPQYTAKDSYGDANPLFLESLIATVWIEIAEADLEWIMNPLNYQSTEYRQALFTFYNGNITIAPSVVGLRIKGGASRAFSKKSWKISFDQYISSQSFYQQKKLLLKATSMTPDFLRERLSRDMIYSAGAKAQRMSYANLYINGAYRGLYVQMENIDNSFLKSRFGSSAGGLWKCNLIDNTQTLQWRGPSCSNYSSEEYSPSNNFAEQNCDTLVHLIDVFNNVPADQFEQAIQQVFDVTYFLRTLIVEILTANWDGGSWDGNNYYLYYDTSESPPLFKYIRQDLDLSFGAWSVWSFMPHFIEQMVTGSVYQWGQMLHGRILTQKILAVPAFRSQFAQMMTQLMQSFFDLSPNSVFMQRLNLMHTSIAPFVLQDYWHRLDVGMNYQVFESNVAESTMYRPFYLTNGTLIEMNYAIPILKFAQLRYDSAAKELGSTSP